jgi:hypothetical protein
MGMGNALDVIDQLASRGLFRVKDLNPYRLSHNWLKVLRFFGHATPHGRGVWSHPEYQPSRYELVQIRFPKAVFWGPSALWLLGESPWEPPFLWLAIGNHSRIPKTLERNSFVILRTRRLESDLVSVLPEGRALVLRVHNAERACADINARMRPPPPKRKKDLATDAPASPGTTDRDS